MKAIGGALVGAAALAVVLVMAGVVDWDDLDPRELFGQDYTALRVASDCADRVDGDILGPEADVYDACLEEHEETWEKARESVYERGYRDGRSDSCDTLRGGYVNREESARTRDGYAAQELRQQYEDGYDAGTVMVMIMGGGC